MGHDYAVNFEVTSVKGPILSLVVLEEASWRLKITEDEKFLHRGDVRIQVVMKYRGVYWVKADLREFNREGRCRLACAVGEVTLDSVPEQKVVFYKRVVPARMKKVPDLPSAADRIAHASMHLPPRSWCDVCIKSFRLGDPHRRRRRQPGAVLELQLDYIFIGRQGETDFVCAHHAIDVDFLACTVIRADKGPVDYVTQGAWSSAGRSAANGSS